MTYLIVGGAILCAFQALRATRVLESAVWLAGVSALTALQLYDLGAHEAAVIELSVGAGLVTVLFVFAISIAGEDATREPPFMPRPIAIGLASLGILGLALLMFPLDELDLPIQTPSFQTILWEDRAIDLLVQLVLIFSGVLGLLGLLGEERTAQAIPEQEPPKEE